MEEGRGVRDGHGAVVRDGQQLVRGHGESVSVDAVTQGAEREIQEVQFSLRQTLPKHWGVKAPSRNSHSEHRIDSSRNFTTQQQESVT